MSFNCETRCISNYRVRNGDRDCYQNEEAYNISNSCPQIQRHRLQCSSSELTCLLAGTLGNWNSDCFNGRDELDYETNTVFVYDLACQYRFDSGCIFIRNYIRNSSHIDTNKTTNVINTIIDDRSKRVIPFRYYCNSFFDTPSAIDELSEFCKNWTCLADQYQCLSGQCIQLNWVCDGKFTVILQL